MCIRDSLYGSLYAFKHYPCCSSSSSDFFLILQLKIFWVFFRPKYQATVYGCERLKNRLKAFIWHPPFCVALLTIWQYCNNCQYNFIIVYYFVFMSIVKFLSITPWINLNYWKVNVYKERLRAIFQPSDKTGYQSFFYC